MYARSTTSATRDKLTQASRAKVVYGDVRSGVSNPSDVASNSPAIKKVIACMAAVNRE
eukprot:CAMPEP_0172749862 /NCGR_PEP_ID=MMETSP1074-20121228/148362_1 /TAXON_ID=2916 /ORGANISM="Ceratium fusus, Strain PA161109" /LENGTH=57 /DNA_ID=CAMNT_0013581901 /DNA_START=300 /DNA_END=473 /DNA_ORIENTATION=-